MNIAEELKKFRRMIVLQKKHCDYKRTVDLSDEYKAHVSGVGLDKYLKQFVKREEKELFEQRVALTNSISPSVASSLQKPFYKVARNKNVKQKINFKNDQTREQIVKNMMSAFYGSNELNTRGLDFWIRNRFIELTFVDPNAFVVIEWEARPKDQELNPYPYEISSKNVFNYKYERGVLSWLFTRGFEQMGFINDKGEEDEKEITTWTLYKIGFSIKIQQYDPKFFALNDIQINPEMQITFEENSINYLVTYQKTNLDFIPAFRVGYIRDTATDGRTFVNPFESAMPYFRKALKSVSELDLSITLHTFPQKLQYVTKCKGVSKAKKCNSGLTADGETCKSCNGSGVTIQKSGQDALLLPLPTEKDEILDLDKLVVYKTPPIDLLKFQDEFVRNLKTDAHLSVYNSNMFISNEAEFAKTATEVNLNTEGIYDTIYPYTEKFSEVWKTVVKIFVRLSGFIGQDVEIIHLFPTDLKLKTQEVLLNTLKLANESEAPSYFRNSILEEIANQVYEGDELGRLKSFTKNKFYPFSGKTEAEIQFLMSSPYVSNFTKVLNANFEAIFTDIEKEFPTFYKMKYAKQWEIVTNAVKPYEDEIKQQSDPLRIDFGSSEQPDQQEEETTEEEE